MAASVTLACTRCGAPASAGAAFCSACGHRLAGADGAPAEVGAASTYAPVPAIDALSRRLAQALGPAYEVGSLLGRGGFAGVYAVRDLRLKRDLAVKVLRPDLVLTEQLIDRFRREAETVAALRHPHIIPIFDIGEKDGLVYLVMPLIRGETLRARMQREERVEPAVVRRVLQEAGLALAAAHEAGVVHRDVKPDNIMLEGRAARVLLMDFGIAKALDGGPELGLTQTGMALGTPHYMSPEQAFGERTVDGRSDQYSLGVVGYAMLAGRLPFPGDSVGMILKRQIAGEVVPLRAVAPDVPDDLADAVMRAMARDPAGRFASAEEFAAAVAPPAADADVLRLPAAPPRIALAARPAVRAAALAAAAAAFALFAWLAPRTTPPEPVPFDVPREAGLAKARALLERQGGPRYQKEAFGLQRSDSALQALRWAVGTPAAERWIARHGGYSNWTLRWLQPPAREQWAAMVGEGGRVVGYLRTLPDSVRPAEASEPRARAAAEAFLAANGYPAAGLVPLEASVERAGGRVRHELAWLERGTVTRPTRAGAAADSAFVRLEVAVEGTEVTRFRRLVSVPDGFRRAARAADDRSAAVPFALVLGGLTAGVGGLVIAARRTRLTALPWRPALGAGAAAGLLNGLGQGLNLAPRWAMQHEPETNWTTHFLQEQVLQLSLINGLLLGAILVPVLAAVVPVLRATRAEAATGAEDLLRGRPTRGALLDACLFAYPMAGALLLAGLAQSAWDTPDGRPYPDLLNALLPIVPLTGGPYLALLSAPLFVLAAAVLVRWVRLPAVAVGLIAALSAGVGYLAYPAGGAGALQWAATTLVLAGGGWVFGVVPAVLAFFVAQAVDAAVTYLGLAGAGYGPDGAAALAAALLPLAVAAVARRDPAGRPAGAPASGSASR